MDSNQPRKYGRYTVGGGTDKRPNLGVSISQPRKIIKTTATTFDDHAINKRNTLPSQGVLPYPHQHQHQQQQHQQQSSQLSYQQQQSSLEQSPRKLSSSQSSHRRLTSSQRYPNLSLSNEALNILNSGGVLAQLAPKKPKMQKDIRSPEAQRNAVRNIIDYLTLHEYGTISPRELRGMSLKVFESIFKFLYSVIVPDYTFHPKFKEEFFDLVRENMFPYVDSISPKSLDSIAAPHSLPKYLAFLSYLVDLCQTLERKRRQIQQQKEQHSTIDASKGITPKQMEQLFWDYSVGKYHAFMQGGDGKDVDDELDQVFGVINAGNMAHYQEKQAELQKVQQDIKQIEQRWDHYEQKKQESLDEEKRKKDSLALVASTKQKRDRAKKTVKECEDNIKEIETMKNLLEREKEIAIAGIKNPEISSDEFLNVIETQTKMDMTADTQRNDLTELQQEHWEKEMQRQKNRCDIERIISDYNRMIKTMDAMQDHPILNEQLVFNPDDYTEMLVPRFEEEDWRALENLIEQVKLSITRLERLESQRQTENQLLQQQILEDRKEVMHLEEEYAKRMDQWKAVNQEANEESRRFNETKEKFGQAEDKLRRDAVLERIDAQTRQGNAQKKLMATKMYVTEQKSLIDQRLARTEANLAEGEDSIGAKISNLKNEFATFFPPVPKTSY
ncbi:HEC/Ndc80p family-domain-containing protein [Chlamydoabsidia padenii]|nr:HEC/Ndc80p family-domain-containing protein [Chlamydoabsidia padenii]